VFQQRATTEGMRVWLRQPPGSGQRLCLIGQNSVTLLPPVQRINRYEPKVSTPSTRSDCGLYVGNVGRQHPVIGGLKAFVVCRLIARFEAFDAGNVAHSLADLAT
jgi:hypothetical protein